MLAVPLPLKSIRPAQSIEITLDAAGRIEFRAGGQSPVEMFRALREGQVLAAYLHPKDIAFYDHTRAWFATGQGTTATIHLRFRRTQNEWSQVLATLKAGPRNSLTVLLVPDDLATALSEEAKMRWIIEGSSQGVIVRTKNGLIFANESVARILGYDSLAEFMRLQPGELDSAIHPDDVQRLNAATQLRMQGQGEVSRHRFRYRCKDGNYVWLEAISRFVNWKGVPAETSWINDISERMRDEEELITSKEAAEFANRTKTEFLANMSHELRTPLNAIIGFSEFMMCELGGPIGTPKYAQYATHIHDSGLHLLAIINDILNLARLEVGRLTIDESTICAAALVESCLATMRARADEGDVALVVFIPPGLPGLRADERAVKQILLNFLSNAIKFTPEGGQVTVSLGEEEDGSFGLVVRDTGVGMSEKEIVIALAPFGQVDSKLARKHQGTGLGLPICESLMHLHGGALRIRSAPGQGTTMIASFPRERIVREAAFA